ncbi:MAG: 50S ribosomal protein L28 [Thermoguttaceae bacterium]|nr:50S ribosomal protein L28 [Thermoguttaceae bacterium]MDW8036970.1 50S ribosomal protein L28 [Thermoguttaceae bacterium]
MARECQICGKRAVMGNQITTRGKAKYLGGVGKKITGISPRQFRPNLQRIRITTPNGTHKRIRICTQCLRTGAVTRIIRAAPFKLPPLDVGPEPPPAQVKSAQESDAKTAQSSKEAQKKKKKKEEKVG